MDIIISAIELNITKEKMMELYRNNLILCDDPTLTVAKVPDWAISEVEELLGKEITGCKAKGNDRILTKTDVGLNNQYRYPKLYKEITEAQIIMVKIDGPLAAMRKGR